mmetsp:Transcript_94009/g.196141  ORF Transcript_94009/g.196141 Transcript_94009/m.196141 type:complete len:468 (-) Transcript_94009:45-1448(-)
MEKRSSSKNLPRIRYPLKARKQKDNQMLLALSFPDEENSQDRSSNTLSGAGCANFNGGKQGNVLPSCIINRSRLAVGEPVGLGHWSGNGRQGGGPEHLGAQGRQLHRHRCRGEDAGGDADAVRRTGSTHDVVVSAGVDTSAGRHSSSQELGGHRGSGEDREDVGGAMLLASLDHLLVGSTPLRSVHEQNGSSAQEHQGLPDVRDALRDVGAIVRPLRVLPPIARWHQGGERQVRGSCRWSGEDEAGASGEERRSSSGSPGSGDSIRRHPLVPPPLAAGELDACHRHGEDFQGRHETADTSSTGRRPDQGTLAIGDCLPDHAGNQDEVQQGRVEGSCASGLSSDCGHTGTGDAQVLEGQQGGHQSEQALTGVQEAVEAIDSCILSDQLNNSTLLLVPSAELSQFTSVVTLAHRQAQAATYHQQCRPCSYDRSHRATHARRSCWCVASFRHHPHCLFRLTLHAQFQMIA